MVRGLPLVRLRPGAPSVPPSRPAGPAAASSVGRLRIVNGAIELDIRHPGVFWLGPWRICPDSGCGRRSASRACEDRRGAGHPGAAGSGDLQALSVSYSDMHGLHGGLEPEDLGDGHQPAGRAYAGGRTESSGRPCDLRRLIALLIELAAWEQRVPDARPVPDESRAHVRIGSPGATR